MYDNVFVGKNANIQPKRILILGESHYEENGEIDGTDSVVKYLAINGNDNETQFYKNIMRTFGYEITEENRKKFWNIVYCGNYIDDLCGKGENNPASKKVKEKNKDTTRESRTRYNNSLFSFINENEIDIVFCFSRLVYSNLPGFAKGESEEMPIKHKTQYLKKFTYKPNCAHKKCDVQLKKPVTVYGLKHPSSSYSYETYFEQHFKDEKNNIGL